jgi:hypothetical protein
MGFFVVGAVGVEATISPVRMEFQTATKSMLAIRVTALREQLVFAVAVPFVAGPWSDPGHLRAGQDNYRQPGQLHWLSGCGRTFSA